MQYLSFDIKKIKCSTVVILVNKKETQIILRLFFIELYN